MRRTKGFTLIELLVVIAIIALLVSILLPSLNRIRELGNRVKCLRNVKGVGEAIVMYTKDTTNKDAWPLLFGGAWDCRTGENYDEQPVIAMSPNDYCVTAVPFMLIRNKSLEPRHFVCPSDRDVEAATLIRHDDPNRHRGRRYDYDFRDAKYMSYSYTCPIKEGRYGQSGVSAFTAQPVKVAIFADKNPIVDGKSLTAWNDSMTEAQIKNNMSQNHSDGEVINVAWADFHASTEPRADIGLEQDNIYSGSGDGEGGSRTSTNTDPSSHKCEEDSFLIGPYYD